jgi:hypothetical protein
MLLLGTGEVDVRVRLVLVVNPEEHHLPTSLYLDSKPSTKWMVLGTT